MHMLPIAVAGSLLLFLALSHPRCVLAQDKQVEAGYEDDLTIKGTGGSKTDADFEVYGYSGFGTNLSSALVVTSGVGSVFIQNHLEIGSNLYVNGDAARIHGVSYAWPASQGTANTFLRNDGSGNLTWVSPNPIPVGVTMFADETTVAWANQPAALTEFLGVTRYRTKFDLSNATQVRLTAFVATAGAATPAKLAAQYSTDQVTWVYFAFTNSPYVPITNASLVVSGWSNLVSGAKADVFMRIVGLDGSGAADPAFGTVTLQFR